MESPLHAKYRPPGATPFRRVWAPDRPSIRRAAARGFTLVEVIVALAVLAVVLVSVFRMQSGNLNAVERLAFNSRGGHAGPGQNRRSGCPGPRRRP